MRASPRAGGRIERGAGRRPRRPDRRVAREHRDHRRGQHRARRSRCGVGRRRGHLAGLRARRAGVPVGHPRIGRRDAGAERRRIRRRGRRHHPPRPTARPPHRRGPLGVAGCPPVRLPHKHSQAFTRPRSCSRWSSRWTPKGAARRCATANWPPRWTPSPDRAPTLRGCGRRCCRCGAGKGMVLDEADHDTWSVGSFFTNPVVSPAEFERLKGSVDGPVPNYPAPDGVKLAAGWLVERAGFGKGYPGDGAPARLSTKHALALTNRGSATTADVIALARTVRDGVENDIRDRTHTRADSDWGRSLGTLGPREPRPMPSPCRRSQSAAGPDRPCGRSRCAGRTRSLRWQGQQGHSGGTGRAAGPVHQAISPPTRPRTWRPSRPCASR